MLIWIILVARPKANERQNGCAAQRSHWGQGAWGGAVGWASWIFVGRTKEDKRSDIT